MAGELAGTWFPNLHQPDNIVDSRYYVGSIAGAALEARSPEQQFVAGFDRAGVTLRLDGGAELALRTVALHCPGRRRSLASSEAAIDPRAPERVSRNLRVDAGDFREWYVNGPRGLEHGWTFDVNPCAEDGMLSVEIDVSGTVVQQSGDHALTLQPSHDFRRVRYGDAVARDGVGRTHPVTLVATSATHVSARVSHGPLDG